MLSFPVTLHKEGSGYYVECPDLPIVHTQGACVDECLSNALEAIESAFSIYQDDGKPIPMASKPKRGQHVVHLPAVVAAKVYLWNAFLESDKTKTEMAEALGLQRMTLNRLLDFLHRSRIEQLEKALQFLGKRLDIFIADL